MSHRVTFLGSPEFAVPSLRALYDDSRIEVTLVVSQPERPTGRGRRMRPPPVAHTAVELGLPLFQPESLRDDAALERLAAERPDALIVVAYGEILTRTVLNLAPHGALNVHPSLLPRHRGATPIPTAILEGDAVTGISIIKLVRRLDAGPIVAVEPEPVRPNDTSLTLSDRLAERAADMLPGVVADWIDGSLTVRDQDESQATFTREWTKDDARIDWSRPAAEIERLVRAAIPWPVAWTTLNGERVQIREAALEQQTDVGGLRPGAIESRERRVLVGTGDGLLQLVTVQPAGRKPSEAFAWWNNLRDSATRLFH